MLQPHLINAILYEPWAIMPEWVSAHAHLIENIFNKNLAFERGTPLLPETIAFADGKTGADVSRSGVATIQVISLIGALTKYDQYCGPAGMLSVAGWIRSAAINPQVDAIIIRGDSPGGMVAGTETLTEAVKYAGTKKPILFFIDDLAASAAYWVASACDEIIANNTTAQVGSIGVMSSWVDMQPVLERAGARFHTILAPQSTEKVKLFDEIRAGNYENYSVNVLQPLAQKFIDSVKASRPDIADPQLTGSVYFASAVVGSLIDSIGTFEYALQRAASLAADRKSTSTLALTQNPIHMSKPDYTRLARAAGVPQLETADGSINLSADMAAAVESVLQSHETATANLQAELNARSNQQSRIDELTSQLSQRDARIAELEQGAGAVTATVTTPIDSSAQSDDFWSVRARLKAELTS